jgi:hypothetical protein
MKEFEILTSEEWEYSRSVTFIIEGETYQLDTFIGKHCCENQLWKDDNKIEVPESWIDEGEESWDFMCEIDYAGYDLEVKRYLLANKKELEGNSFDYLMSKVLEIVPNATFDQDNEGQIIIYTDLRLDSESNVKKFEVDNA